MKKLIIFMLPFLLAALPAPALAGGKMLTIIHTNHMRSHLLVA